MALTPEQRERRKSFIGSSDIAAICGFSEFANAADVWLEKTGRLKEGGGSDAADMGIDMESAVLEQISRKLDRPVMSDIWLDDGGYRCANLDGVLLSDAAPEDWYKADRYQGIWFEAPAEAKCTGYKEEFWGEEIDAVPAIVKCQLLWQMDRIGAHCQYGVTGVIWPSFKQFKFELYRVARDQEAIDGLNEMAEWFWKFVKADVRPPDITPHLETLKRMKREPASMISLDDEAECQWLAREAAAKEIAHWTSTKEQCTRRLLDLLGDAEAGILPCGDQLRYMEQNSPRAIDLDILEFRAPDLYKDLVTQGKHRVLRRAKAKVGKRRR